MLRHKCQKNHAERFNFSLFFYDHDEQKRNDSMLTHQRTLNSYSSDLYEGLDKQCPKSLVEKSRGKLLLKIVL